MIVTPLVVGSLQTNCYLVWDENTSACFIIDPGDDADFITTEIISHKLKLRAILLTHGHYDHCLACLELKLNFPARNASSIADAGGNIPIYLNPKDNFLYQNASKSAGHWSSSKTALKQPSTVPYPKEIKLGNTTLKVIHAPGHTPGSICLYSAPHLFVGDTVFADGVGRTDFSYSSSSDLQKSIKKILSYPKNTLLYPGHEDTPVFLSDLTNS